MYETKYQDRRKCWKHANCVDVMAMVAVRRISPHYTANGQKFRLHDFLRLVWGHIHFYPLNVLTNKEKA